MIARAAPIFFVCDTSQIVATHWSVVSRHTYFELIEDIIPDFSGFVVGETPHAACTGYGVDDRFVTTTAFLKIRTMSLQNISSTQGREEELTSRFSKDDIISIVSVYQS